MDEVKIHCKNIDAATAVRKLRAIHDDVQGKFHDQWDWMGADFCVEVLATLLTASEAQVAALTEQLQDADDRADTNLGELNRISQDNAWLREQLRVRSQPVSDEEWMDATGTTAVFENELMTREAADDLIAARSAAPGKESQPGVSTGDAGTDKSA